MCCLLFFHSTVRSILIGSFDCIHIQNGFWNRKKTEHLFMITWINLKCSLSNQCLSLDKTRSGKHIESNAISMCAHIEMQKCSKHQRMRIFLVSFPLNGRKQRWLKEKRRNSLNANKRTKKNKCVQRQLLRFLFAILSENVSTKKMTQLNCIHFGERSLN